MWNKALKAALLASCLAVAMPAARADRPPPHPPWRGDIHHFHERDIIIWRQGHWVHGHHDGRFGWWWVVGGIWYFYPAPIYPYPDPYLPPEVIVVQPQSAPPPQPQQYWYYCDSAHAYYPYVTSCPSGWRPVPAAPPGAPQ
jgi:hypothetical protein